MMVWVVDANIEPDASRKLSALMGADTNKVTCVGSFDEGKSDIDCSAASLQTWQLRWDRSG